MGTPLQERTPTVQNHVKRIVTKSLQNQCPMRNMKMYKRPDIFGFPLHSLNYPTISFIPQNSHNSTNIGTSKKPASLSKRWIKEELLDHNSKPFELVRFLRIKSEHWASFGLNLLFSVSDFFFFINRGCFDRLTHKIYYASQPWTVVLFGLSISVGFLHQQSILHLSVFIIFFYCPVPIGRY